MYDIKEILTYRTFAKYPYNIQNSIDFTLPQGILVSVNGMDLLIDGNHRMEQAFLDGLKTMRVFYITSPRTIRKFKIR